jgi:hypothetical protein
MFRKSQRRHALSLLFLIVQKILPKCFICLKQEI